MTKSYALSDGQWDRIKDLLPGQAGQPGVSAKVNRLFVAPCRTATVQVFLGRICLPVSATRAAQLRQHHKRCARAKHDDLLKTQIQRVWQANMQVYSADKVCGNWRAKA